MTIVAILAKYNYPLNIWIPFLVPIFVSYGPRIFSILKSTYLTHLLIRRIRILLSNLFFFTKKSHLSKHLVFAKFIEMTLSTKCLKKQLKILISVSLMLLNTHYQRTGIAIRKTRYTAVFYGLERRYKSLIRHSLLPLKCR